MTQSKTVSILTFTMCLAIIALGGVSSVFAETESEETSNKVLNSKLLLAQDFFDARPVSEMADRAIAALAMSKAPQERSLFLRQMRLNMDYSLLEGKLTKALLDTYTDEEIAAMTAFYGSDVGKSVMEKQGAFQSVVSPILQQMLDKAFVEANYGQNGAQSRR